MQASMTMNRSGFPFFLVFVLLLLLLLGGVMLYNAEDSPWSHGDKKHPLEASQVRNCLKEQGPDWVLKFDKKNRGIQYCWDKNKKMLGIRVMELVGTKWVEITAYWYTKEGELNSINRAYSIVLDMLYKYNGYLSFTKPGLENLEAIY